MRRSRSAADRDAGGCRRCRRAVRQEGERCRRNPARVRNSARRLRAPTGMALGLRYQRPQEGDVANPDDDELLNIYLMTDIRLSDLVSKMERTLLELRRRTDSLRCLRLRLLDRTATVQECRALDS